MEWRKIIEFLVLIRALRFFVLIIIILYHWLHPVHKNIREGMWWGPANFRPGRGYPPYTPPAIFQEN